MTFQNDPIGNLTKVRRIPRLSRIEGMLRGFSPGERMILYACAAIMSVSALAILAGISVSASVTVPSRGGELTEGEIGPARFINPLLTLSGADEDIAALVYSGLMRALPDGSLVPDLASGYEVSEDGATYTFTLRPDAVFHDGQPVTSADVLFTIQTAQNAEYKSVHRADWEGVAVSAPDERTVVFRLPHAYAPFLENAALGILPKHLWAGISAQEFPFSPANTRPVGSGPFMISKVSTDATGAPTRYELVRFPRYALGRPYLSKITFVFFPNQEAEIAAWNAGGIDAVAGVSPEALAGLTRQDAGIVRAPLPRVFGVFFNQNKAPALADASARKALEAALDKEAIVAQVLHGYGETIDGPIPPGPLASGTGAKPQPLSAPSSETTSESGAAERAEAAREILRKGGWEFDEAEAVWKKGKLVLAFTIATADEPELAATANAVAAQWQAAGASVSVHVYPLSELNTVVIRPRNYDAILFGEVVGRTLDLFAFWHSSQRNDPGLNLAMYASSRADSLLSEARATTDEKKRLELYGEFAQEIAADRPAVFLYVPEFVYLVPPRLSGMEIGSLTTPAERFLGAYRWYTDTERVWSIFSDEKRN